MAKGTAWRKSEIDRILDANIRKPMTERVTQRFGENLDSEMKQLQLLADDVQGSVLTSMLEAIGGDAAPEGVAPWPDLGQDYWDRKLTSQKSSGKSPRGLSFYRMSGKLERNLQGWNTQQAWGQPKVTLSSGLDGQLREGYERNRIGQVFRRLSNNAVRYARLSDALAATIVIDLFPKIDVSKKSAVRKLYMGLNARSAGLLEINAQPGANKQKARPFLQPLMEYKLQVVLPQRVQALMAQGAKK